MKNGILIISLALLAACTSRQNNGSYDLTDSLGNKMTDTTGRGDTAYYERMNQKTGLGDTASSNSRHGNDTATYERMPSRTNRPDSSK